MTWGLDRRTREGRWRGRRRERSERRQKRRGRRERKRRETKEEEEVEEGGTEREGNGEDNMNKEVRIIESSTHK